MSLDPFYEQIGNNVRSAIQKIASVSPTLLCVSPGRTLAIFLIRSGDLFTIITATSGDGDFPVDVVEGVCRKYPKVGLGIPLYLWGISKSENRLAPLRLTQKCSGASPLRIFGL